MYDHLFSALNGLYLAQHTGGVPASDDNRRALIELAAAGYADDDRHGFFHISSDGLLAHADERASRLAA